MPDLLDVTLDDMRSEVARELKMREQVYPHLIRSKKLSNKQAAWRIQVMQAIADLLDKLPDDKP